MKSQMKRLLLAVLAVTTLTLTAAAQNAAPRTEAPPPTLSHAVYVPSQSAAKFTQVDRDDYRRCDGDHDRDDRNCHWRRNDRDRYDYGGNVYYGGNAYVGPGYSYGPGYRTYYGPDGWYDKHGKWHKGKHHDER